MSPFYLAKDYLSNNKNFKIITRFIPDLLDLGGPKALANKTGKKGVIVCSDFPQRCDFNKFLFAFLIAKLDQLNTNDEAQSVPLLSKTIPFSPISFEEIFFPPPLPFFFSLYMTSYRNRLAQKWDRLGFVIFCLIVLSLSSIKN